MAIYSLSYLAKKGALPRSAARTEIMSHCLLKVRGGCSFWKRSKLTKAGFELAKSVASDEYKYGKAEQVYSGNDQFLKDVMNEKILVCAKKLAFSHNLIESVNSKKLPQVANPLLNECLTGCLKLNVFKRISYAPKKCSKTKKALTLTY